MATVLILIQVVIPHTNRHNIRVVILDIVVIPTTIIITIDIDHCHIKVAVIIAFPKAIDLINIDLLPSSIVHHLHLHLHIIHKIVTVVTLPWIRVMLLLNKDVRHQIVSTIVVATANRLLVIVSSVVRQVTSVVTVRLTNRNPNNITTLLWKNPRHPLYLMTVY